MSTFPSISSLPAWSRTAERALAIKVRPRPANIGESRQILAYLRRHGQVQMYEHLRHHPTIKAPNTIMVIYQFARDATTLLRASPLRFEIDTMQDGRDEKREVCLTVEPSRTNFHSYLQRQHYAGNFNVDQNCPPMLNERLLAQIPLAAMADCQIDAEEIPFRIRKRRMEVERQERRGAWVEALADIKQVGAKDQLRDAFDRLARDSGED